MQGKPQAAWLNIQDNSLQPLLDMQHTLLTAASLSAMSRKIFATEIEPKLAALVADHSQTEATFRSCSSDEIKHALKACIYLRNKNVVGEKESFQAWAQRILAEVPPKLGANLAKLSGDVEAKLVSHRGEKAQRVHDCDLAQRHWRQKSKEARGVL